MKAVTFGEIMLRLAPEGYLRFLQEPRFQATFGGGEANVAVSLAQFGVRSEFITALPDNDIGEAAVMELKKYGVETAHIVRGGGRVGIYYLEKGASQRPSKVIYDRKHSSFAEAKAGSFDFASAFSGADWFHFTGITPALSESAAENTLRAAAAAKEAGLTVSCDLNYRKTLWSSEEACRTMEKLMRYVDVCIANEEDADKVFGIRARGADVAGGKLDRDKYAEVARLLTERFGFRAVAITLRESLSAFDNIWSAMLYSEGEAVFSKKYPVHIVDRVGGGDSFSAGLIYGMMQGYDPQKTVGFAVAASCLKHSIEGDFNRISAAEAEKLAAGDGSGRVLR